MSKFSAVFNKMTSACICLLLPLQSMSQSISYTYDGIGRLTQSSHSTATGATSATSSVEYDSNGPSSFRVKRILGPSAFSSSPGGLSKEFHYLNSDELAPLTFYGTSISAESYTKNGLNQYLGESSPEKGTISLILNTDGSIAQATDARGITLQYGYDQGGSLSSVAGPDTSASITRGAQGLAGAGQITHAVKSGSYGSVDTSIAYYKSGYVKSKTQVVTTNEESGTSNATVSYGYTAGKLTSITYPSGHVVSYIYNGPVVSQVLLDGNPLIQNIVFTPGVIYQNTEQGAFTSWTGVYNSGASAGTPNIPYSLQIDAKGNISAYSFGGLAPNNQWNTRTLTWNLDKYNPRLASRTSPANARDSYAIAETFTYNNLDQALTSNYTESLNGNFYRTVAYNYAFNQNNGLSSQTRTVTGPGAGSQTMSSQLAQGSDRVNTARIWNTNATYYENQSYTYDNSGFLATLNSTLDSGQSYSMGFTWDAFGELVKMTNSNPTTTKLNDATLQHGVSAASYYYDALGRRVKKVLSSATNSLINSTHFVYSDIDTYKILTESTLNYEAITSPTGYGNFSSKEYIYLPLLLTYANLDTGS